MRCLAFVTGLALAAVFALPIVGAIVAAILGNLLPNLLTILLVSVAWYGAVLLVLRIRARRRKKVMEVSP